MNSQQEKSLIHLQSPPNETYYAEQITFLTGKMMEFQQSKQYIQAEVCKNKIKDFQSLQYRQELSRLDQHYQQIKEKLEQGHLNELENINTQWDDKFRELEDEADKYEGQMIESHKQDLIATRDHLEQQIPISFKESSELLNLKKVEERLADQQEYIQAHQVQQRVQKMQNEEFEKYQTSRNNKIGNQLEQVMQKQENELICLRKRIGVSKEELRNIRQKELETFLQKYQNNLNDLQKQHKIDLKELEMAFSVKQCNTISKNTSMVKSNRPTSSRFYQKKYN